LYIAQEFMGEATDPTVCVSGNDESECYIDDISCLSTNCDVVIDEGEIPYDGPNPQVEVDVPENQVGDVTEYSFGLVQIPLQNPKLPSNQHCQK
jgi:hypothetical protein